MSAAPRHGIWLCLNKNYCFGYLLSCFRKTFLIAGVHHHQSFAMRHLVVRHSHTRISIRHRSIFPSYTRKVCIISFLLQVQAHVWALLISPFSPLIPMQAFRVCDFFASCYLDARLQRWGFPVEFLRKHLFFFGASCSKWIWMTKFRIFVLRRSTVVICARTREKTLMTWGWVSIECSGIRVLRMDIVTCMHKWNHYFWFKVLMRTRSFECKTNFVHHETAYDYASTKTNCILQHPWLRNETPT